MSDNHDLLNDNDMYSFSGYEADDMRSNNGIDAGGGLLKAYEKERNGWISLDFVTRI